MIHAIFCNPPVAIARLGGSPNPMAAYGWIKADNPRTSGETVIEPRWSLEVLADGSVQPVLPNTIEFKDGDLIRPVSPFIELWAWVGAAAADEADWRAAPLTEALLAEENASLADLKIEVTARNLKAARRRNDPRLAFGNFPALRFAANDHAAKPLVGVSPPGANPAMIPAGRSIPLGAVRMIRPRAQPAAGSGNPWVDEVDISVLRLRFTPPTGLCYGPDVPDSLLREAGSGGSPINLAVPRSRAFLNPNAGWHNLSRDVLNVVFPGDTVDMIGRDTQTTQAPSLGVVDDTSEALLVVRLALAGGVVHEARANVMVSPPDFAPDRRPFYSLADEINDLAADPNGRDAALNAESLEAWVADLFERVFETVDLLNVDRNRLSNAIDPLPANRLRAAIPGDGMPAPTQAAGSRDALRNSDFAVSGATQVVPLPLTLHARMRHRALSDVQTLRDFVAAKPTRFGQLIRGPFEREDLAGNAEGLRNTTMRMPPFMAQSTPSAPLSLTAWQYGLLMQWHATAVADGAAGPLALDTAAISDEAQAARDEMLARPENADLAW